MKTSRRTRWLLATAVAALPTMAIVSIASAQYQNGQNGHALDANTQAGSGGQNAPGPSSSAVSGNQLITGNATAGRSFEGRVGYRDPDSFEGTLPTQQTDNFIRDSNGVPTPYQPGFSSTTPRYFNDTMNLTTAPPPGTVSENFTGTIVGTGLTPSYNGVALDSPLTALRDQDLGGTVVYGFAPGTLTNNVSVLPPPGTEDNGLYTANPLIIGGLYPTPQENAGNTGELESFSIQQPQLPSVQDRFGLTQNTAEQLSNPYNSLLTNNAQSGFTNQGIIPAQPAPNSSGALNANGTPGNTGPTNRNLLNSQPMNTTLNPLQGNNPLGTENPLGPNSTGPTSMQQPLNTPVTPYGQQPAVPAPMISNNAYSTSINTNQSSQQWLLVPPAKQSTQYQALQQRLEAFDSQHPLSDQEAAQQFQQQKILAGLGGGGGGAVANNPQGNEGPNLHPELNPAGRLNPGAPAPSGGGVNAQNPIKPSDLVPLPLRVSSLAQGFRNATLKAQLDSAEELMRQGKFASAIEKYDAAIQMTNNNNPLILLGRANAELGAEFYSRAEVDLRRAVASDPSVLMGQYDLNKMMDPKRLDAVRSDLEDLAKSSKSVRPALLLAYLEYNTGHEAQASKYLAQAENLVGNSDPVIELMRTHWSFQSPQMNPADNKQ